ncbi:MAG: hypothetical protein M3R25_14035 [Bacteroidota bacterium]|nr:hypothetical protein [Bacteroidota bacterium]
MLPFTTYIIPEFSDQKIASPATWLWIILSSVPARPEEDLLGKIITSLKANQESETYRYTVDPQNPFSISGSKSTPKLIISFGIPPSSLGLWLDIEMNQMRELEKCTFILTSPLLDLSTNAIAKKLLWSSLLRFLDKK